MLLLQQSMGLDLRDNTLRLVLLGRNIKGISLVAHFIKTYPGLSDKGKEAESIDNVIADLQTFLSDYGKPTEVIVGLSRDKVILREVDLPMLSKDELEEIISYEIEKHIPLPSQEVYYDYQPSGQPSETGQKVLLGIIKREDLDFYLQILERIDLQPTLATPLSFALKDCPGYNHIGDRDLGLMVDIGERELELDLMQGDRLLLSRSLPADETAPPWGEPVQGEAGIGQEGPAGGGERTQKIGSGLLTVLSQWLRTKRLAPAPEEIKLFLSGARSYDSFLSDYIHDASGLDVFMPNPFDGLTDKNIPGRLASSLAIATGLAVKGLKDKVTDLNLLPPEMRVRRASHALAFTLVLLVMLFLLITATAYTGLGSGNWFYLPKRMEIEKVVTASTQLQDQVKAVKDIAVAIDKKAKDVEELEKLMKNKVSTLEILKELSVLIPGDAWLDKVMIDNQGIEINGYADSSSSMIGLLEDSPLFENVIFPSTITKRGGEKERFRIKMDIQKGLK